MFFFVLEAESAYTHAQQVVLLSRAYNLHVVSV